MGDVPFLEVDVGGTVPFVDPVRSVLLGAQAGLHLPLSAATKLQYDRMVAVGLGELDKSGIAELTFKGRQA